MKRLPLMINILLFALLCMVLSYWGLQIFKPKIRPIQAPVSVESYEPSVGQWGNMFGQSAVAEAAPSSYQLKGVIVARHPRDSVAIIMVEGKPNFTIGIGKELMPGVKLQEVHSDHVVVSESGNTRRIELPAPAIHGGITLVPGNAMPGPETMLPPTSQLPPQG